MLKIKSLSISHARACLFSLGRMLRYPLASLLTIAVIGVCLALPASLYVVSRNIQSVSANWGEHTTQIMLYLKPNLSKMSTQDLLRQLHTNPDIANVQYITPEAGLKNFGKVTGTEKILESLKTNPLPGVVIVQPILSLRSPFAIKELVSNLQQQPEIDLAKLNMQWLTRFNGIVDLIKSGIFILSFLFGIGILLIIGNTIRLATQNEREEIIVLKLVGATDAFIRRPFLYFGIWYGLFGGILACLFTSSVLWYLSKPVEKLTIAYNSDFYLRGLSLSAGINLLIIGMVLGLIGTWIVVSKNLRN